jgi:hypothetical protein
VFVDVEKIVTRKKSTAADAKIVQKFVTKRVTVVTPKQNFV